MLTTIGKKSFKTDDKTISRAIRLLIAILMWLFEAVPAWTTSVMVVVLLLFTTSLP